MVTQPYPGSDEAVQRGCKCPVLDNRHGQGYHTGPDGTFVMVEDCPLHGHEAKAVRHMSDPTLTRTAVEALLNDCHASVEVYAALNAHVAAEIKKATEQLQSDHDYQKSQADAAFEWGFKYAKPTIERLTEALRRVKETTDGLKSVTAETVNALAAAALEEKLGNDTHQSH